MKKFVFGLIFIMGFGLALHIDVYASEIALLENENAKAEINMNTSELYVLEVYNERADDDYDFEYPWDIVAHRIISVRFSDNVKKIPDYAFGSFAKLETIDFTGIDEIGNWAFFDCKYITEVTLSNMKRIGDLAFSGCQSIKYVNLNNIDSIGIGAFMGDIGIEQVKLNNIKEMGMKVFYGCTYILDVYLTDVKDIPEDGFSLCHSLQSINLRGVETIGYKAFYDDYNIRSIDLTTVSSVDEYAFSMDSDITHVHNNELEVINASNKIKKSNCFWNRDVTFVKENSGSSLTSGDGTTLNFSVVILIVVAVSTTLFIFKKFISK